MHVVSLSVLVTVSHVIKKRAKSSSFLGMVNQLPHKLSTLPDPFVNYKTTERSATPMFPTPRTNLLLFKSVEK